MKRLPLSILALLPVLACNDMTQPDPLIEEDLEVQLAEGYVTALSGGPACPSSCDTMFTEDEGEERCVCDLTGVTVSTSPSPPPPPDFPDPPGWVAFPPSGGGGGDDGGSGNDECDHCIDCPPECGDSPPSEQLWTASIDCPLVVPGGQTATCRLNVRPSRLLDSVEGWEFKGEITEGSTSSGSTSWTREWVEPGQVQVRFRAGGGRGIASTRVSVSRPEGISEEDWTNMNLKEKLTCALHLDECALFTVAATEAIDWAVDLAGDEGAVNNIYDAMRHAYWQAMMTRDLGPERAKAWGDAHEWGSEDPAETCMDQNNNVVGRGIAIEAGEWVSWATLRQLVRDAADRGDLQDVKGC